MFNCLFLSSHFNSFPSDFSEGVTVRSTNFTKNGNEKKNTDEILLIVSIVYGYV